MKPYLLGFILGLILGLALNAPLVAAATLDESTVVAVWLAFIVVVALSDAAIVVAMIVLHKRHRRTMKSLREEYLTP